MKKEKRSKVVRLVLADREKDEIQRAAEQVGIPVAVYVRAAALAAAKETQLQKNAKEAA